MSQLVLKIKGELAATHTIKMSDAKITIGRAKVSTIRINAPSVSSNHAVIERGYLKDIGSTNGTLINNEPMGKNQAKQLCPGFELQFGEIKVSVSSPSCGSRKPPAKAGEGSNKGDGKFHKLFPFPLLDNTGSRSDSKHDVSELYGSVVGVFFCAHWHGPSKTFLANVLTRVYYDCKNSNKAFKVVIVPSENQSQKREFQKFFETMPPEWLSVTWTSKKKVVDNFKRPGGNPLPVSTLVLLDENGREISTAGRVILKKAGAAGYPWTKDLNKQPGSKRAPRGRDYKGDKPTEALGDLSQSKRFGGVPLHEQKSADEEKKSVEDVMQEEFSKIIGHESIKDQLKQFHKKVQLDKIRAASGQGKKDNKRLYHMIFSGPPGTGKTTMANLVAKLMVKMGIIQTDNVVFVNNALDLLAGYVGQTAPKVDAKVEEARGGVIFIDEAYSIVKSDKSQKDSFGKEAIETIMKHLDPPSCVFIFAGYQKEMEDFLNVNSGLSRRMPYRYNFEAYDDEQLMKIFIVVCKSKEEDLGDDCIAKATELLATLTVGQKQLQNAGLINNWVAFAQMERDDRIDIDDALANPSLASLLLAQDFTSCMGKLKNTS